jgi:3-hydroxy-9,10-secoandrosta-1,3,5(10)-triene-9,17-dione monooxygenase reductase component
MAGMTDHEISKGVRADAHPSWRPREPIASPLGNFDFELRPGEHTDIRDDVEAQAAARAFRDALGRFCTGVTVVTSLLDGEPVGMTCQAFSSVSLEPPLVMFIPAKTSRAWPQMQQAGHFCVNLLARDQEELSNVFASRGTDKYAGVSWTASTTGAPLLDGVIGFVDCTIHAVHDAGDHWIVIGRVQDLGVTDEVDPLLFYQGRYRSVD